MTKLREVYKCNICGNVVEIAHEGADALVCCNQPMEKLAVKYEDKGKEKHVPVVSTVDGGIRVEVGDVHHPMEDEHSIKFIEVLTADKVLRAELKPGQEPVAEFDIDASEVELVREYCNKHGLWTAK